MTITLALLRGINVGGHNKVPMAELRAALARSGLPDTQTYIQSGNIVLKSPLAPASVAATIEATLEAGFGVATRALCFSRSRWASVLANNPFPEAAANPTRLVVLFSRAALTPDQRRG